MKTRDISSSVPALERGCEIIELVSANPEITFNKLYEMLDIPRASFGRIINTFIEQDFLQFDENRKVLSIGDRLLNAVLDYHENQHFTVTALNVLENLWLKWRVTFTIAEYKEPFSIIWRAKRSGPANIRTRAPGFCSQKLNISAQGQLFLSLLPDQKIKEYFDKGMAVSRTPFSITTCELMMERVQRIREQGYALQEKENNISIKQLAVPIKFRNTDGIYSLFCFLPLDFSETEKLKDDMLLEANKILSQE